MEVLLVLGIILGVFGELLTPLVHFIFLLLFGWVFYLQGVLPKVAVNPQIALAALVALVLATAGLHIILRWYVARLAQPSKWRVSWTLKITAMVLMLFATSIAATGIVHQTAWLFSEGAWIENRSWSMMVRQLSNLKQVGLGLRLYAGDHGGKFPRTLDELVPEYLPTYKLFYAKDSTGEPVERIIYYSGYADSDASGLVVVASPQPVKGKRAIVCVDSSGEIIKEEEFQKLIQKQQAVREQGATAP